MLKNKYAQATQSYLVNQPNISINERHIDFCEYDQSARKHISVNLLHIRQSLNMSQESFAKFLGVSRSQYRKYEAGTEVIRLDIAQRITIKCGRPLFLLLQNSKYEELLDLPKKNEVFDRIWFYGNSFTDCYFEKLCSILAVFLGNTHYTYSLQPSKLTANDFTAAMEENEHHIYTAIGEGIRAVRTHLHYSQEAIAELMGISVAAYQEYEKGTQRPRFNLLIPARWTISTSIHPFIPLAGTHMMKIRSMQNQRQIEINRIIKDIPSGRIKSSVPLVEGFFKSVKSNPSALFFDF